MFSKIQSKAAVAAVMIGALQTETEAKIVPPPQYDYQSSLSCSQCIQAGYQYVYDNGTAGQKTQLYKEIATGGKYTGFCCTTLASGTVDCNDSTMWHTWTSSVDQAQVQNFNTQFKAYYTSQGANGLEKAREYVSILYKESILKKTVKDKRNYFLGLTADITIEHKKAAWITEILAKGLKETILTSLLTDLTTIHKVYGDLVFRIFTAKLVTNIEFYFNNTSTTTIDAQIKIVQDLVTTWKSASEVKGDLSGKAYLDYVKEVFALLYDETKLIGIQDTATFATTETNTITQINQILANPATWNTISTIKDDRTTDVGAGTLAEPTVRTVSLNAANQGQISEITNSLTDAASKSKMNSKMFTSQDIALNSCAAKKDICGARLLDNYTDTAGKTISVTGIGAGDSCHYLIETKCDLPEVKITSNTLNANWNLDFIEFSEGNAKMLTEKDMTMYPDLTAEPNWIDGYAKKGGVFPFLIEEEVKAKFPSEKFTTTYKNKIPVQRVIDDLTAYNLKVKTYNDAVKTYNTAKTAYDAEVAANKASYDTNKKAYEERNGFTCLFGCEDQKWAEVVLKKPVKPTRPAAYAGNTILSLKVNDGLGAMIGGTIDITSATTATTAIKAFGVHGQVTSTGKGFSQVYDTKDAAGVAVCKKKTVMLSLYPTLKNTVTTTAGFGAAVSRGKPFAMVLTPDTLVAVPADPAARLDEKTMWEFRVLADKAVALYGAAAGAMTLAALTLF